MHVLLISVTIFMTIILNPLFGYMYLHFIKINFGRFILFFCLKHSPLFHFPLLSMLVLGHQIKQPHLPILTDWSHLGDEPHQSDWSKLLVASQTFVIVQAAIFALSGFQQLRECQDSSVFPRGASQSAPRCVIIRSQTIRQQLRDGSICLFPLH